jgi:hypothetical protein
MRPSVVDSARLIQPCQEIVPLPSEPCPFEAEGCQRLDAIIAYARRSVFATRGERRAFLGGESLNGVARIAVRAERTELGLVFLALLEI